MVALTTVAVLYHVVPLFQAASPDGDGSYHLLVFSSLSISPNVVMPSLPNAFPLNEL